MTENYNQNKYIKWNGKSAAFEMRSGKEKSPWHVNQGRLIANEHVYETSTEKDLRDLSDSSWWRFEDQIEPWMQHVSR